MSTTPGDKIWYEDVRVLFSRWAEFFPTASQTAEERVNALCRLVIYATLAAYVYNRETRTLVMGAGVVAVVSFAFGHGRHERYPAPVDKGPARPAAGCTPPTKDNPFANYLVSDASRPDRAPACEYQAVKDKVREHFNNGLFRNATDIYETENSQHQFYTMPVTTGIPDTGAFANFLYSGMKTCKENQANCPSNSFVGNPTVR